MKTINDLTVQNINDIYSIIIGKEQTAGRIEWTPENDFVIAIFKVEKCDIDDRFDTVEYGITITDKLIVNHVWFWVNKKGSATDYQPLYNHHAITKYLIKEGFDV